MLTYHQCGHNDIWNRQSFEEDGAGDGLILSPVNIEANRIQDRFPSSALGNSWMDPQFYLPHDSKNKLATYPFFPGNVLPDFTTADFESHASEVARECLAFQARLGLQYLVIPTRYFDDLPENYLHQLTTLFVHPFIQAKRSLQLRKL